jgi:hypothetical protein
VDWYRNIFIICNWWNKIAFVIMDLFTTSTTPKGNGSGITGAGRTTDLADPHQIALWRPYS